MTEQSEKIQCNICNSLILRCNLKRHQETQIFKNKKTLLTTMSDEDTKQKRNTNNMNIIRDIMKHIKTKLQHNNVKKNNVIYVIVY